MDKSETNQQPAVNIRIEKEPATMAQKQAWRALWQKLIGETKAGAAK